MFVFSYNPVTTAFYFRIFPNGKKLKLIFNLMTINGLNKVFFQPLLNKKRHPNLIAAG